MTCGRGRERRTNPNGEHNMTCTLLTVKSTEVKIIATMLGCKPNNGLVNKLNKLHRDGLPEEGLTYGRIYRAFLAAEIADADRIAALA